MPNITGTLIGGTDLESRNFVSGSFAQDTTYGASDGTGGFFARIEYACNTPQYVSLNASRSSSIYGGSTTVQQSALSLIPQLRY